MQPCLGETHTCFSVGDARCRRIHLPLRRRERCGRGVVCSLRGVELRDRDDLLAREFFRAREIALRLGHVGARRNHLRVADIALTRCCTHHRVRLSFDPFAAGRGARCRKICLGLCEPHLKFTLVDGHEHGTVGDVRVLTGVHRSHETTDLDDDRNDVSVHLCIVGTLMSLREAPPRVAPVRRRDDENYRNDNAQRLARRRGLGLGTAVAAAVAGIGAGSGCCFDCGRRHVQKSGWSE